MEEWRAVVGHEGNYEVSNAGSVRSLDRLDHKGSRRSGARINAAVAKSGHLYATLSRNGHRRKVGVHVLVLEAFVGPRPDGMDGCHWNGDPGDNRLPNLRWDTRSANILDSVRNGSHSMANRTHCPQKHEYTPDNTYVRPNGARACNECRREYRETHREQRREKGREYMRLRRAREKEDATTTQKAT